MALDKILIGARIRELREQIIGESREEFAQRCDLGTDRYVGQLPSAALLSQFHRKRPWLLCAVWFLPGEYPETFCYIPLSGRHRRLGGSWRNWRCAFSAQQFPPSVFRRLWWNLPAGGIFLLPPLCVHSVHLRCQFCAPARKSASWTFLSDYTFSPNVHSRRLCLQQVLPEYRPAAETAALWVAVSGGGGAPLCQPAQLWFRPRCTRHPVSWTG